MAIATKNGVPIIKDGSIAAGCGCCGCAWPQNEMLSARNQMVADGAATLTSVALTHEGNSSPNTPMLLVDTTNPIGGVNGDPYAAFSRTYSIGGNFNVTERLEIQSSSNRGIAFYLYWAIAISRVGGFLTGVTEARAQSVVRDGRETLNFFFVGGLDDTLTSSSLGGSTNYTTAMSSGRQTITYVCEVDSGAFVLPATLVFSSARLQTLFAPAPTFSLSIAGASPLVLQGAT
jgi:hypothetical protein